VITDTLNNASLYAGLSPRLVRAFDYLRGVEAHGADSGTYEVDGRLVCAIVQEYATLERADGAWEAHRRHIDLQYVVSGTERIGYARTDRMSPGRYDEERDLLPLTGEGDFLTLGPGDFMVLFPGDAHMPRIAVAGPQLVRKIVVKIAVSRAW